MKKLSICIPTYNRAGHLRNCLHSIALNAERSRITVEVCVSDNCSPDNTEEVVRQAALDMDIRYQCNERNIGIPGNFLKVVGMATGEFAWLLGDDDLVLPDTLAELLATLDAHPDSDFFYVNSYHLSTAHVLSFPQPFDTANLPRQMQRFSSWPHSGELAFMDLIDPRRSFDFLGGMFLSVFRRALWQSHVGVLDARAVSDPRTFSYFDNTFPHVKIFAAAFANSRAFFRAEPLSVCLTGAREWAPMYPLVKSVRLVEALQEYRKHGLPFGRYWRCRNFALKNFIPDLVSMFVHRARSGFEYVSPIRLLIANCLYPNFYISVFSFAARKTLLIPGKLRARFGGQ
ncbi:MAG: glycosyltransferase family 2 protein [Pseudomonadota bacterium]